MGTSGDAGLAQDRSGQQPAKPVCMLQDGKLVPGIEGDDGLQHRRQVFGLTQDATPFIEAGILVPVEIIDQRIGRTAARLFGSFDCSVRSREQRIDNRIVDAGEILGVVGVIPLPFRIEGDRVLDGAGGRHTFGGPRTDVRRLAQRLNTLCGPRPIGRLARNPSAGAQHVAGDGEFVGAGIAERVVMDEVFEVDEFAVDPQRGKGIGKMHALEKAAPDRRASNPLVETGQSDTGVEGPLFQ